jgi:hypothetical protein
MACRVVWCWQARLIHSVLALLLLQVVLMSQLVVGLVLPMLLTSLIELRAKRSLFSSLAAQEQEREQRRRPSGWGRLDWGILLAVALFSLLLCDATVDLLQLLGLAPAVAPEQPG